MNQLMACSGCGGFLGSSDAVCPHCDAQPSRTRRRLGLLVGLAGSASLGLTMMACYGGPVCDFDGCVPPNTNADANADATGVDGGAPD